jgi:hypothetical protein
MIYFVRMVDGLQNTKIAFTRMTLAVLNNQPGRNILAYVDDIVVKRKQREYHIKYL